MMAAQNAREIFAANRAKGEVHLEAVASGGVTRRHVVDESGSLRVRFPSDRSGPLTAVLVNTAGGIAGGDRFSLDIRADAGARLAITSAAAEKIYRSHGPDSRIDVRLSVGGGASLYWMPQETIVFDDARVRRTVAAELAPDAALVLCEIAVFGRTAMGEAISGGLFADRWRVRRAGRLIFADDILLDGAIGATLSARASAAGGVAIATLLIAPGNERHVEAFRALNAHEHVDMAASSWNGIALMRFCSNNSAALRMQVMDALSCCAGGAPRSWLQ